MTEKLLSRQRPHRKRQLAELGGGERGRRHRHEPLAVKKNVTVVGRRTLSYRKEFSHAKYKQFVQKRVCSYSKAINPVGTEANCSHQKRERYVLLHGIVLGHRRTAESMDRHSLENVRARLDAALGRRSRVEPFENLFRLTPAHVHRGRAI